MTSQITQENIVFIICNKCYRNNNDRIFKGKWYIKIWKVLDLIDNKIEWKSQLLLVNLIKENKSLNFRLRRIDETTIDFFIRNWFSAQKRL